MKLAATVTVVKLHWGVTGLSRTTTRPKALLAVSYHSFRNSLIKELINVRTTNPVDLFLSFTTSILDLVAILTTSRRARKQGPAEGEVCRCTKEVESLSMSNLVPNDMVLFQHYRIRPRHWISSPPTVMTSAAPLEFLFILVCGIHPTKG